MVSIELGVNDVSDESNKSGRTKKLSNSGLSTTSGWEKQTKVGSASIKKVK